MKTRTTFYLILKPHHDSSPDDVLGNGCLLFYPRSQITAIDSSPPSNINSSLIVSLRLLSSTTTTTTTIASSSPQSYTNARPSQSIKRWKQSPPHANLLLLSALTSQQQAVPRVATRSIAPPTPCLTRRPTHLLQMPRHHILPEAFIRLPMWSVCRGNLCRISGTRSRRTRFVARSRWRIRRLSGVSLRSSASVLRSTMSLLAS